MNRTLRTILIVADRSEDCDFYRKLLQPDQEYDYQCVGVSLGQEGLDRYQLHPPDAVLLDGWLSDMDGLEFMTQLQIQTQQLFLPVIVVTTYGNEAIAVQAIKAGAQNYLVRDQITPESLQVALNSAIVTVRLHTQLHQQLAEIEAIYQTAPIGLNVVDTNLRFVRINQRLAEMNGYSVAEHIGHTVRELLPNLADAAEQVLYPILETGEPLLNVEIRGETPAQPGVERIWLEHFLPLKDGDRVTGISTVCEEITDRKRAETALQESEERFRTLADNISQLAWMADETGWIVWYNRRWFDYTGTTMEEMQGWGWRSVHHPDHIDRVVEHIRHCFTTGELWEDTFPLRGNDGLYRWFLSRAIPIRDAAGKVVRWFGTNTNIDDYKQAEEALQHSEERYRCLVESIPQLVWSASANGQILDVNQRWTTFTGLTLTQIQQQGWQTVVHPDDVATLQQQWEIALRTGGRYQAEGRMRRSDGVYRWHLHQAMPQKTGQGDILKWFGTATDIDDHKRLEAERDRLLRLEQAARAEAERLNRIKDEFLAILSHELRSPLNPIMGWARLLRTRKLSEARTMEALETIERNVKLQTQLIDDLLDMAKILRGKLSLNPAPTDLVGVIEAAIETVRTAATAKSITLQSVLTTIGHVSGDAARLQQIVWNLLSNAIKFTPNGGKVEIQLTAVANQAHITVMDTGKGINPAFLPYLFESFQQEDASITRQYGGLGLGLAIVRYLVEAHGGTVFADSAGEGQGATFTVCLPLLHAPSSPDSPLPETESKPDLTGIRILAVDDDPDSRELLAILLDEYGATVKMAASATEAFQELETFRPDILISDIGMPNLDGYTFLRQVRARSPEQGGQIPAIALTAYAREIDQERAHAAGFQQHLTKPIDPDQVLEAVLALAQPSLP